MNDGKTGSAKTDTPKSAQQAPRKYTEEREFVLRFELRCPFPDDYEGEEDGYVWAEEFQPIAAEIVNLAAAALRNRPGWRVRTGNRGRPLDEEVTLIVERVVEK